MNFFKTAAVALAAAVALFSCDSTRQKPDPVQIRVQNLTDYDVLLRDAPDKTKDPLLLLRSVEALDSSVKQFRILPAADADRLTFYPYFLLPVLTVSSPGGRSMISYYEEFYDTEITLTERLVVGRKEYTVTLNDAPYRPVYKKAYVAVENAAPVSCELLQGNTVCQKSSYLIRGIGSVAPQTVKEGETAVFAFSPSPFETSVRVCFATGSGADVTAKLPPLAPGDIIKIRLTFDYKAEISKPEKEF